MKSTAHFINEHKIILRALDVLDAMCASLDKSGGVQEGDFNKILDFLRWFADAHHQTKEETILFPALRDAAASQGRNTDHLALEHGRERSLVEGMETDLRLAQQSEFISAAGRLTSTLRNHIYKEERILFETADTILTPAQDEMLLEQLNRFDTAFDKRLFDEKLTDLRALEWRYLRR